MKEKKEFSKALLIQESVLIWIMTITFLFLSFYCIREGYTGSLPWLSAMIAFPWTAYGISQGFYYSKSKAENTKNGIKYETILTEIKQQSTLTKEETIVSQDIENENKGKKIYTI